MKNLRCDVCKKDVDNPIKGRTFFHITTHDLCESCNDALHARLKPLIRQHVPYTEAWYEQTTEELIVTAIAHKHF